MRDTAIRTTKTVENLGDLHLKKDETFRVDGVSTVNGEFKFDRGSKFIFLDGNEKDGYVLTVDNDGVVGLRPGAINAYGPKSSIQFNNNDKFDGHKEFIFNLEKRAFTLGERTNADVGVNSFSQGLLNVASNKGSFAQGKTTISTGEFSHSEGSSTTAAAEASHAEGFKSKSRGQFSHAEGYETETNGNASHAEGLKTISFGAYSHAEGNATKSRGEFSHTEGDNTVTYGKASHAQGSFTRADGDFSFSSGIGVFGKEVLAKGVGSFNHSYNNENQKPGHGALAPNSAILGGINHHISEANSNSVILGGTNIKLEENIHINTVAVPNLAIFEKPLNGGSDDILTWDAETKKIRRKSQSTVADIRLKTDIKKKEDILESILSINVYEYKNGPKYLPVKDRDKKSYGLIAQEVEKIEPIKEVVTNNNEINGVIYKGIDNDGLVPLLIQSIKELNQKIDGLNAKVRELEIKVNE